MRGATHSYTNLAGLILLALAVTRLSGAAAQQQRGARRGPALGKDAPESNMNAGPMQDIQLATVSAGDCILLRVRQGTQAKTTMNFSATPFGFDLAGVVSDCPSDGTSKPSLMFAALRPDEAEKIPGVFIPTDDPPSPTTMPNTLARLQARCGLGNEIVSPAVGGLVAATEAGDPLGAYYIAGSQSCDALINAAKMNPWSAGNYAFAVDNDDDCLNYDADLSSQTLIKTLEIPKSCIGNRTSEVYVYIKNCHSYKNNLAALGTREHDFFLKVALKTTEADDGICKVKGQTIIDRVTRSAVVPLLGLFTGGLMLVVFVRHLWGRTATCCKKGDAPMADGEDGTPGGLRKAAKAGKGVRNAGVELPPEGTLMADVVRAIMWVCTPDGVDRWYSVFLLSSVALTAALIAWPPALKNGALYEAEVYSFVLTPELSSGKTARITYWLKVALLSASIGLTAFLAQIYNFRPADLMAEPKRVRRIRFVISAVALFLLNVLALGYVAYNVFVLRYWEAVFSYAFAQAALVITVLIADLRVVVGCFRGNKAQLPKARVRATAASDWDNDTPPRTRTDQDQARANSVVQDGAKVTKLRGLFNPVAETDDFRYPSFLIAVIITAGVMAVHWCAGMIHTSGKWEVCLSNPSPCLTGALASWNKNARSTYSAASVGASIEMLAELKNSTSQALLYFNSAGANASAVAVALEHTQAALRSVLDAQAEMATAFKKFDTPANKRAFKAARFLAYILTTVMAFHCLYRLMKHWKSKYLEMQRTLERSGDGSDAEVNIGSRSRDEESQHGNGGRKVDLEVQAINAVPVGPAALILGVAVSAMFVQIKLLGTILLCVFTALLSPTFWQTFVAPRWVDILSLVLAAIVFPLLVMIFISRVLAGVDDPKTIRHPGALVCIHTVSLLALLVTGLLSVVIRLIWVLASLLSYGITSMHEPLTNVAFMWFVDGPHRSFVASQRMKERLENTIRLREELAAPPPVPKAPTTGQVPPPLPGIMPGLWGFPPPGAPGAPRAAPASTPIHRV